MPEDKSKKIRKSISDLEKRDPKSMKAIAVRYDTEKDRAPKILATGKGSMAQEILKVAEENNIPMYEDPTLADLLSKLDIETEIPAELYTLVAEVLAFVYQLDKMAKKRASLKKKFVK